MSTNLDPIVAAKLRQFARRRRWLIVARGICAGLVTFLTCLTIAGFVDWYWLLEDSFRYALTAGVYALTAIVVWLTSVRRLMRPLDREEIAAQVELAEPQLKENLLSAVELAVENPGTVHDSPLFRSLLQGSVATQMGRLKIPSLLPVQLVFRWLIAAGILVATGTLLLTSSDDRFRRLAVRTILPGANIARVSRIRVEILEPTPQSKLMAEDETVAVVVAVSGGTVDEVTLEISTASDGVARQIMRHRGGGSDHKDEYTANIHVMDETVEYRILAGDAITQKFRLESRPRPHVITFQKTLNYPDYSLLPPRQLAESHGDLIALEGTQASLSLVMDQQVSIAELVIDPID
ncbi:MAG: hypothetical protein KDA91_25505, partial [Planctomycetaceae bacterium]|nr:hypothetical protein [Planctomycetaceae bacterium]